ncbi:MAG: hypothetical protein LBF25_02065 [Puniceicoccales bacterium]|jgi:hypothetical protein|nr:hypothetical protein [Puniceicoccales bacterium]
MGEDSLLASPTDQTDQTPATLPGSDDAVGEHPVAPGPRDSAAEIEEAAKQREDMPSTSLVARTSVIEVIGNESKDIGFFRALWNYISNSSTKSIEQAKLNLAAQDYLKDHPSDVDGILQEIATNPSSQDPKIVHAFAGALKEIDPSRSEIQFSPPALAVHSLAQKFPAAQITPELMVFCKRFHRLAQGLSADQITPELMMFCKRFPRLAQGLPADQITPELMAFCNEFPGLAQGLPADQITSKLIAFVKDLKANSSKADGMLWQMATNASFQDPQTVHAFITTLKEVDPRKFESFCADVKGLIDAVLTEGAKEKSAITPDHIKYVATLVGELRSMVEFSRSALALHSLVQKFSADQITPELMTFYKDSPGVVQKLPAEQITLELITFTNNLKTNPGKVDGILRGIIEDPSSQDPQIVHAFITALKEVDPRKFENFCAAVKGEIDAVLTEGAKEKSAITSGDKQYAADLVGKLKSVIEFSQPALALHSLVQKFSADQVKPELIAFCNDFPGVVQRLPAEQITLELITFCKSLTPEWKTFYNNFPEQARALAERKDLKRASFQGTDHSNGLTLTYNDSCHKPKILSLINPGLFEGKDRDDQIESFLEDPAVTYNFFYMDGIRRREIPHISLPNGVEILSNFGGENSEYCKKTEKPYDQVEYLKYMLDQFKAAYGNTDEAVKAFKVLVQNFTGSGNTLGVCLSTLTLNETILPGFDSLYKNCLICAAFMRKRAQPMMQMDKDFNIDLNITACMFGEGIRQFNEQYESQINALLPEATIFGITISSHIPAVINETMDQRGQQGKQTTTFGTIESFGNGGSN